MCGLVALHHFRSGRPADGALLAAMSHAQRHRGPDGHGVHLDGAVGLAHRRLAVIDREGGAQPMLADDGALAVVFNGELYGYREVRRELAQAGTRLATESDTEVLLHLYRSAGEDLVDRLRGDFAFVLWDRTRRRLVAARDRLGVKPLCWALVPDGIAFASEEKALLVHPHVGRTADPEAVQDYLLTGTVSAPRTMFAAIRALPPGHVLVADERGFRIRRYWDVPFVEPAAGEREELAARVAERVRSAVEARLVSDVPVGAFLSGGLDSSTVVANAAPAHAGPLPTFTVQYSGNARRLEAHPGAAFDGIRGDDARYAASVAHAFGTEHHEVTLSPDDLEETLERAIWHRDRPLIQLVEHGHAHLYRSARGRATVLLSGEGGDEVFEGYYYWLARRTAENTRFFPWVRRAPEPVPLERGASAYDLLEAALSPSFARAADVRARQEAEFREVLARPATDDFANKLCYVFLAVRLGDFLAMEDRLAMAEGLEARVPLADASVVELVAGVSSALKMGPRGEKALLRDGPGRALPAEVRARVKSPFPVPFDAGGFHDRVAALLRRPALRIHRYLDPGAIFRVADGLGADAPPARREAAFRLWALERWHATFEVSG